jgi:hypothetical protein
MSEKKISEISCPKCGKMFYASKPRTKKQWRTSLIWHLMMSTKSHHNLKQEEATSLTDCYLVSQ